MSLFPSLFAQFLKFGLGLKISSFFLWLSADNRSDLLILKLTHENEVDNFMKLTNLNFQGDKNCPRSIFLQKQGNDKAKPLQKN